MFKVETGITIPPNRKRGGRKCKYPWADLGVNDSFFIPNTISSMINITYASRRLGFKLTKRAIDGGVRIWRVA